MDYIKKLVGDRIFLSPIVNSEDEIEKFTKWMNDFQVTDYTGRTSQIINYLGEKEFLENASKESSKYSFDIVDLTSNQLIGTVSFDKIDWITRKATLGIFIGDPDYRSHGYGTEAIKLLLDYGFNYLNLNSVQLELLGVNERAHKCYYKCGFKDVGRYREAAYLNGKYYDKCLMDILKSDFNEECIRNKNVK